MPSVNYDDFALDYDRRYELHDYPGIRSTITRAIDFRKQLRILEVGCGTGKWLEELARPGCEVAGIDPSAEMLGRASGKVKGDLRQGYAQALPWENASFDIVLFINSLHHIAQPASAVRETFRVLRPGGTVLSIGLDPHEETGDWFVYEFFPTTIALDLARFPSRAQRMGWLEAAGFRDVVIQVAERLRSSRSLEDALRDGVLQKSFTSQLTSLSSAEYDAGIRRIHLAAQNDESFSLNVDLAVYVTQACRPV